MPYWKKWKLVRTDGTPTKDYIGQNGLTLKTGRVKILKGEKYEFVLLESGAVGILYGFGDYYGPFFEIIDHKGWEVKLCDSK